MRVRFPFVPNLRSSIVLSILIAAGGCGKDNKVASESDRGGGLWGITVESDAFENGGPLPAKYTAGGGNVSPPLRWSRGPAQTREFVVVIEDVDSAGKLPAVHWVVYGLSPDTTSLPEGAAAEPGLTQGKNHTGVVGYIGPDVKPEEKKHRYFVQVMALPEPVRVEPGVTLNEFLTQMNGEALMKGMIVATCGKE